MPCCDTIIRSNMTRIVSLLLICFVALAACTNTGSTTLGSDGRPLPTVYKIRGNPEKLQFRMLDSVNALRQASGLQVGDHGARTREARR